MRLDFNEIEIENFKPFAKRQGLVLSGGQPGLHFLRGQNLAKPKLSPNGCGKSSVWDAVIWCLYGRTADNLRSTNVRPWDGKGTTTVVLSLTLCDAAQRIARTANPNSLTLNGNAISQEGIEKFIGINYKTFMQTVIFGQDKSLFFDLEPREQMRLFADVLDLDRWEKRSQAATDRIRELEPLLQEVESEQASLSGQLTELNTSLQDLETKSQRWDSAKADNLDTTKAEMKKLKQQREDAKLKHDSADLAYDSACTEAEALDVMIGVITTDLRNKREQQTEFERLQHDYESLATATAKNRCPTCGQRLKNDERIKKRYAELDLKMRAASTISEADFVALEHQLDQCRTDYKRFKQKAEQAEAEKRLYAQTLAGWDVKVGVLQQTLNVPEANPFQAQTRTLIKRRHDLQERLAEQKLAKRKLQRRVARTKFWVKGFRDILLQVTEDALQELELVSNSMLADVGMDDWRIHYAIEKETQKGTVQRGLQVGIESPYNIKPVPWACWSGGEKQRLKLVGAMALSEVLLGRAGVQVNLQVFDEPTKFLSLDGARDICALLADSARQRGKHYWLVDHLAQPSAQFISTATVIRQKGGASMIEVT